MIGLIAAVSNNGIIGNSITNDIPWKSSKDLKLFKAYTLGTTVIMGRKTWESLGCKPLPGRENIVVSSSDLGEQIGFRQSLCLPCAISTAKALSDSSVQYIIGGAKLYAEALEQRIPDKLIITRFPFDVEGDVKFPEIPSDYILTDTRNVDGEFIIHTYRRVVAR